MRINTKYTPALHAELVRLIRAGHFRGHAAAKVGITEQTLDKWLSFGDSGESPYVQLTIDIRAATADYAAELETLIMDSVKPRPRKTSKTPPSLVRGDWKAAAWLLERKLPELYGARGAELDGRGKPRKRVHSPWTSGGKPPTETPARLPAPAKAYDA